MKYISELEHPHLETISKKLKKMPKTEYNKKVSIRVLSKEIHFLKKRGYTFDQISEILCREGLNISTSTLKSYLYKKSYRMHQAHKKSTSADSRYSSNESAIAAPPPKEHCASWSSSLLNACVTKCARLIAFLIRPFKCPLDLVNIGLQAGVETFYLVTLTALIGLISQEDLSASAPTWHVAISLNPLSSVLRMWQLFWSGRRYETSGVRTPNATGIRVYMCAV